MMQFAKEIVTDLYNWGAGLADKADRGIGRLTKTESGSIPRDTGALGMLGGGLLAMNGGVMLSAGAAGVVGSLLTAGALGAAASVVLVGAVAAGGAVAVAGAGAFVAGAKNNSTLRPAVKAVAGFMQKTLGIKKEEPRVYRQRPYVPAPRASELAQKTSAGAFRQSTIRPDAKPDTPARAPRNDGPPPPA